MELVLEAFDQYWRKTPSVNRLVFKSIPEETTRLAALQRGEVDDSSAWIIPAVFWTALAGGVLLKGPVIVMICAFAALALILLDRSARWLRH